MVAPGDVSSHLELFCITAISSSARRVSGPLFMLMRALQHKLQQLHGVWTSSRLQKLPAELRRVCKSVNNMRFHCYPGRATERPASANLGIDGSLPHFREVMLNAGPQRQEFADNSVSSAKYSLLSFAPRFLFEVFGRVAYLYFLVQAALSWWPAVSPFDPWGSTVALAFVVAVSAISELWQDGRRHRADWLINNRKTRVMHANGSFREVRVLKASMLPALMAVQSFALCSPHHGDVSQLFHLRDACTTHTFLHAACQTAWRDVRVGDIIFVRDDEECPCDLVCLFCALADRVCYIQTTNLGTRTFFLSR